jgi:hypothetical protein
LRRSGVARGRGGWHAAGVRLGMNLLIFAFPILAVLLAALVSADHHAAAAVETARVREFEQP